MVATLTVGVIYKMNKTAEYEALLTQQQQMQQEAAEAAASSSKLEIPPIKSLEQQKQDSKIAAKNAGLSASSSSAPEISVSTDEGGNQTITEEYSKPEPTEEELHNPSSAPETPSSSKLQIIPAAYSMTTTVTKSRMKRGRFTYLDSGG